MMKFFNNSKFSLINYLCEKDYLNCLKIIIKQTDYQSFLSSSFTKKQCLSFNTSNIDIYIYEFTIIVAAKFGSIQVIDYFYNHFSRLNDPPEDFSFKTCDYKG